MASHPQAPSPGGEQKVVQEGRVDLGAGPFADPQPGEPVEVLGGQGGEPGLGRQSVLPGRSRKDPGTMCPAGLGCDEGE